MHLGAQHSLSGNSTSDILLSLSPGHFLSVSTLAGVFTQTYGLVFRVLQWHFPKEVGIRAVSFLHGGKPGSEATHLIQGSKSSEGRLGSQLATEPCSKLSKL